MGKPKKFPPAMIETLIGAFRVAAIVAVFLTFSACSGTRETRDATTRKPQKTNPTITAKGGNGGISGMERQSQRPGEVLVKFKDDVTDDRKSEIIDSLDLETIRIVSRPNLYLLKIRGNSSVQNTIRRLQKFNEVEYAEPNYMLKAQ